MKNSKNVEVTVVATIDDHGGVNFNHSWDDGSGVSNKGPIEFPLGASNNRMKFLLDDQTGLKLQFVGKAEDAVWFSADGCPTGGPTDDLGQIKDKTVEQDAVTAHRKKLTLTNVNTEDCTLHYALRFDGNSSGNAKPPYVYDPEIRNRGGGGSN